jgi:glycosyltransferase 2 family protein
VSRDARPPADTTPAAARTRRRGRRHAVKAAIGISISVAILYWVLRGEDFGAIAREIRDADMPLFLLATALVTVVFWIRAWRWRYILEPVHPGIPFRSRFAAVTIGFMGNNLLPMRIGEFMRAYALSRMERVPVVASFSSLVIERLLDAVFVIGFLFLATLLPAFPGLDGDTVDVTRVASAVGIFVLVMFGLLGALVIWPERVVWNFEHRVARVLPHSLRRPLVDALRSFLTGLSMLRQARHAARAVAWSAALWFVHALGFYAAFHAFALDLPFSAALFFSSVLSLAVSVPSGPGFFGPWEGAAVLVLGGLWGIESTRVLGFAIGFHLAGFIPVTIMGLVFAWRLGLSLREVRESEDVVEAEIEAATGGLPRHE